MSTVVILAWMLAQFPGSLSFPTHGPEKGLPLRPQIVVDMPDPRMAAAAKRAAAYQEKQFTDSFNHLVKTLVEFADQYNSDRKIDVKKVKAMKKAWRDLEKSDPWFRAERTK